MKTYTAIGYWTPLDDVVVTALVEHEQDIEVFTAKTCPKEGAWASRAFPADTREQAETTAQEEAVRASRIYRLGEYENEENKS